MKRYLHYAVGVLTIFAYLGFCYYMIWGTQQEAEDLVYYIGEALFGTVLFIALDPQNTEKQEYKWMSILAVMMGMLLITIVAACF